jgi:outer membrane protein OmpA-like peptidoglycan-associated protein
MARYRCVGGVVAAFVLLWQGCALAGEIRIMTADQIAQALVPKRSLGKAAVQRVDLPAVQFEFNSDRLTPKGKAQLDELAKALSLDAFKGLPVQLAGNTDAIGSEDYNQSLSERRAAAARAYLAQAHNLDPATLKAVGFGKTQLDPRYPPTAPEQRRVTVELTPGG